MMNIFKRWSPKERDHQIEHLLAIDNPEELKKAMENIARTAFKAGMIKANVLDGTARPQAVRKKYFNLDGLDGQIEMGEFATLPELYVQHKALC